MTNPAKEDIKKAEKPRIKWKCLNCRKEATSHHEQRDALVCGCGSTMFKKVDCQPKFVDQTIFGKDGNCLSAVIAGIFGIPLEEAWYFDGDSDDWIKRLNEWSFKNGWVYHEFPKSSGLVPKGLHVIGGDGGRGFSHAVLGENGKMIHDPHPDKTGLKSIEDYGVFVPVGTLLSFYIRPDNETALAQRTQEVRDGCIEMVDRADENAECVEDYIEAIKDKYPNRE